MNHNKKELNVIMYLFFSLFLLLGGYFSYFLFFESKTVINNPYNARQENFAKEVVRGPIFSNNNEILAETIISDGVETRYYPYGSLFSHIVGYADYGKSGIEQFTNFGLLSSDISILEKMVHDFSGIKDDGNKVITTLDLELQQVAYEALGNKQGAVVAIDPSTGKILAMVSKPDFNPNKIAAILSETGTENAEETFLLNRTTQGLYPPGSTFKIVTALAYMRENPDTYKDFLYTCDGVLEVGDYSIRCYNGKAHGEVDLKEAFAKSCNGAFASMGLSLDLDSFKLLSDSLLFNKDLPLSLPYKNSSFVLKSGDSDWEILQSSIGQGKTMITPIHNALLAATIANNGTLMKPYFLDRIENYHGDLVEKYLPETFAQLMSIEETIMLTEYMQASVEEGTGYGLKGASYTAAGKTGTAEHTQNGNPHAWFIGFAPVTNPVIAISVIVENAGTGSEYAVPIAKKIMDAYLK
ncbi:MAG: penicillin-binding protein 2 [Clostridiales bacterium]|nr:penicillin-binding protein 2 [Clostridiales bacterium]